MLLILFGSDFSAPGSDALNHLFSRWQVNSSNVNLIRQCFMSF